MSLEQSIDQLIEQLKLTNKMLEELNLPGQIEAVAEPAEKCEEVVNEPAEKCTDTNLAIEVAEMAMKIAKDTGERKKIKALVSSIEEGVDKIAELSQKGLNDLKAKLGAL
jgi:hypothetical protein